MTLKRDIAKELCQKYYDRSKYVYAYHMNNQYYTNLIFLLITIWNTIKCLYIYVYIYENNILMHMHNQSIINI